VTNVKLKKCFKNGLMSCVNALAMLMVIQSANSACLWVVHQPEFPREAKAFIRKK